MIWGHHYAALLRMRAGSQILGRHAGRFHSLELLLVLGHTTHPQESTALFRLRFQGHNYLLGPDWHHLSEHGRTLVEPREWRGAVAVEGALK